MYYYLWSLIITLILFTVIQFIEKQKYEQNNVNYDLFTLNNLLIFVILYIIITIIFFFISTGSSNNLNKLQKGGVDGGDILKDYIDPNILHKVPDNINIGIDPGYDSN